MNLLSSYADNRLSLRATRTEITRHMYRQAEQDVVEAIAEWRSTHGVNRASYRRGVSDSIHNMRTARDHYYAVSGREMADAVEREMMRSGVSV